MYILKGNKLKFYVDLSLSLLASVSPKEFANVFFGSKYQTQLLKFRISKIY